MSDVTSGQGMPRAPASDVEAITATARADLLALINANLFITGGTGYIGRWLLESLCHANRTLDLGLRATVLSRNPAEFTRACPHLAEDPIITLLAGDVRDFTCDQGDFSHVIHAATDVVASIAPLDVFDVTVNGTRQVLEFSRRQGVQNVLLLSSGAVYGHFPDDVEHAAETLACLTDVTTPRSAYGLGKIASEWLVNAYGAQHGMRCTSARIFAQVGPYLELGAQFAAGNFIRDILKGDPIIINGDGTSLRSYMYATDLVVWLWAILVRGQRGCSYNVGSEQGLSIKGLAETIVRVSGCTGAEIKVLGQAAPGAAPARYLPDTSLARTELGLFLIVPVEDALRRTLDWHRPRIARSKP